MRFIMKFTVSEWGTLGQACFVACLLSTSYEALPQAPHFQTFYNVPPPDDQFSVKKPTYLLSTES